MVIAAGAHVGPWCEEDLVDLPDDGQRYELVEGALLMNPPPGGLHQRVSLKLAGVLDAAAPAGLFAVEAMGVRLPDDTVLTPDVLVASRDAVLEDQSGILDASVVCLVAEIVSPGSRTTYRLTKPALYARAGIGFFWRVELEDGPMIVAYRLHEGRYVESASAQPEELLVVDEPFPASVAPGDLRR